MFQNQLLSGGNRILMDIDSFTYSLGRVLATSAEISNKSEIIAAKGRARHSLQIAVELIDCIWLEIKRVISNYFQNSTVECLVYSLESCKLIGKDISRLDKMDGTSRYDTLNTKISTD